MIGVFTLISILRRLRGFKGSWVRMPGADSKLIRGRILILSLTYTTSRNAYRSDLKLSDKIKPNQLKKGQLKN